MKYFIVWKKLDNSYYYKLVSMTYRFYYVGYKNQFKHEVVLIIPFQIIKHNPIKKLLFYVIKFFDRIYKKL